MSLRGCCVVPLLCVLVFWLMRLGVCFLCGCLVLLFCSVCLCVSFVSVCVMFHVLPRVACLLLRVCVCTMCCGVVVWLRACDCVVLCSVFCVFLCAPACCSTWGLLLLRVVVSLCVDVVDVLCVVWSLSVRCSCC